VPLLPWMVGFYRAAERLNLMQSTISQASVRGAEQTPGEHDVKPSRKELAQVLSMAATMRWVRLRAKGIAR
jgi:hypothetical protein